MGDNEDQHDENQYIVDKRFLANVIQNRLQTVDPTTPNLRIRVIDILRRTKDMGRRRGGSTKIIILSLNDLVWYKGRHN